MSLESDYRSTGRAMMAAFESQREVLQQSSALIMDGRDEIGYGVVISAEGHILTKHSEIEYLEKPVVVVGATRYQGFEVLGIDREWDVALIQVDATDLVPVLYAASSDLAVGTWVVANGVSSRTQRRLLMGVVSAKTRELPALGGVMLGVVLESKGKRLKIQEIIEQGGAKSAGLQVGDLVLAVGEKEIKSMEDFVDSLKDRHAGTFVDIKFQRAKETRTAAVLLRTRDELSPDGMRDRNDQMSGDFSKRRSGFPRVMQHSILGSSKVVGGPLLDLDGRCVGMNIARANRAESFAIPVEELKSLAERMLAGASSGATGE